MEDGEHQLPLLAVGNRFQGVGIDNLHDVGVFPYVHAILADALKGQAGTVHLGKAVGVIGVYAVEIFDFKADVFGVWFRADVGLLEVEIPEVYPRFLHLRVDVQQIARRGL